MIPREIAERLCEFMEKKPEEGHLHYISPEGWWDRHGNDVAWKPILSVCPEIELLGRLRLIEKRLTFDQWLAYRKEAHLFTVDSTCDIERFKDAIHATPAQKATALDAVIGGK